ncbi:G-patch domain-containing protein [Mycena kentingensis (nom. inval.)]|nr:G-patch domain-containing protein [Mycena kentingensis (nom. inval.)]
MSLNDKNLPGVVQGADVYPGMANPTSSSVPNNSMGMGDDKQKSKAAAGVIESEPGIIESTNVHPLREDSNELDGWAHTNAKTTADAPGIAERAANVAGVAVESVKSGYARFTGSETKKDGINTTDTK